MANKFKLGGLVLLLFLVVGVTFQYVKAHNVNVEGDYIEAPEEMSLGLADSAFFKYAQDVIGTKTATTTVGVNFAPSTGLIPSATSTYVTKIGDADEVTYTFRALKASSTARLIFAWQGSNDDYCDTTATSGGNLPLVSEIAWYDIGDHLNETVHTKEWTSATSTQTINWTNPMDGQGKAAHLHHLDFQCLRLGVQGVSTTLHAQISTK